MGKLYIITVVTESKYYFPYLKDSCKLNGIELIVLGYGEKWKGFNWRSKLIINFLSKLNRDDIVCVIDGYDVLCTRNLLELPNIFKNIQQKKGCKMIVGHDKIVKHNKLMQNFSSICNKFFFSTCQNILINIGTYIGYSNDIIEILNKIQIMNSKDDADDQILITKYCNIYPNEIYIDTNNEIFLAIDSPLNKITDFIIIDNRIVSYNGNKPFFIHGPGSTYLDELIIKLYGINPNLNDEFKNKFIKMIIDYLFKYYLFMILFFLILIYLLVYFIFIKKNKY
jgi:hypothetical protein